jgi:serine/threonine protein phosphatase PrpC
VPAALLTQPTLAFAPETAHTTAFLEANRQLRTSRVDDSLSGTTAITCMVRGASLCVANVGDSRACLAEDTGRALAAINLSCDQTPFRRVRAAQAAPQPAFLPHCRARGAASARPRLGGRRSTPLRAAPLCRERTLARRCAFPIARGARQLRRR